MNARAFKEKQQFTAPANQRLIRATAVTCIGISVLLMAVSAAIDTPTLYVGWLGMLGIILTLHFGLFELLAIYWRRCGRNVTSVMRQPLQASSLAQFWSERWNTAFNLLVGEFVFTPLNRRFRRAKTLWLRRRSIALATLAVFALSGLVHELVISFPARGGYGLPTAYFLLQGFAVLVERSRIGKRFGFGHGFRGWLFTALCAGGPAFWLFHPPFVRAVILPMLQTLAFTGKIHL